MLLSIPLLSCSGLLKSLISKLGASQRIRLLTYARCALRGLSPEASPGSGKTCAHIIISYHIQSTY